MGNIYLLTAKKPSKLHLKSDGFYLTKEPNSFIPYSYPKNIYITSDEQIKDVRPHNGKWQLEQGQILNKFPTYLTDLSECELVVMTTDPDLISDGVQAIDDEFLKWFVKNPSCDKVDLGLEHYFDKNIDKSPFFSLQYKIIIPQEFPTHDDAIKEIVTSHMIPKEFLGRKEESTQETLEEYAENEAEGRYPVLTHQNPKNSPYTGSKETFKHGVRAGADWQSKRMYGESEVLELLEKYDKHIQTNFDPSKTILSTEDWFEQNKKK